MGASMVMVLEPPVRAAVLSSGDRRFANSVPLFLEAKTWNAVAFQVVTSVPVEDARLQRVALVQLGRLQLEGG